MKNIGESLLPRSLCSDDGSLYTPTDKSSPMYAMKGARVEPLASNISSDIHGDTQVDIIPRIEPPKSPILDSITVLSMKKS